MKPNFTLMDGSKLNENPQLFVKLITEASGSSLRNVVQIVLPGGLCGHNSLSDMLL